MVLVGNEAETDYSRCQAYPTWFATESSSQEAASVMQSKHNPARGTRRTRWPLALSLALGMAWSVAGQGPLLLDDWKLEVLHDKKGKAFPGLVLKETPAGILFQYVLRRPGERMVLITTTFAREDVERVDRLSGAEREKLAERLRAIESSSQDEKERLEKLELKPAPWGKSSEGGWSYTSDYFVLVSNARPEMVRRVAVRLDQIYTAYTRLLPPRRPSGRPTTIVLVHSLAEYQALQREQGRDVLNPAYYDAARNQIVWGCDLQRLSEDQERIRKQHAQLRERLRQQEAELNEQYKGKIPRDRLTPILSARRESELADLANQGRFERATKRLFQILYHEAFHAYLANFVFPAGEAEVPHWLNEGLAQLFETALLEAGELRIGPADPERQAQVKTALAKGELVALADLLVAGPRHYVVAHAGDQQISDRYYLASWALVSYLAFERKKLCVAELERYVDACKREADPVVAFQGWVGQRLGAFESAFHQYLLQLRHGGSGSK